VRDGSKGQARAARGFRFLKAPQFLAASLSLKKPARVMALLMVMTVCVLVSAAVAYRIRHALTEHEATCPDHKGKRIQSPTARWVFHYFVGLHGLSIPGQGLFGLNLTDEHLHLLQLLGKRYVWLYR
jgi:transposase